MSARFPFPIPNGWFAVAWSSDVERGAVKPLRCFSRELVLFRTESGDAGVMNAFCPHLGAHLAEGGRVDGDTVVCPFHGWRWAKDGACAAIPYAKRVPPGLSNEVLPIVERGGLIFAWHHAEGAAPEWDVPELSEFVDPGWTTPEPYELDIATCCQELGENAHDPGHFTTVHGVPDPPDSECEFRAVTKVSINRGEFETPRGRVETRIEGESFGLGLGVTRVSGLTDMCFLATQTPVDEENLVVRWAFSVPRKGDSDRPAGVGRAFIDEFKRQLEQDKPIWEHKRFEPRPRLCDEDGPIAEYRKWSSQFYSDVEAAGPREPSGGKP